MDKDIYTYPDGTRYKGEWKDNKRHGKGVLIRPDGTKYSGEWLNDKPDGQGTLTYPDGRKRIGEWKEGKFVGENQPVADQGQQIKVLENENRKLKEEIANLKQRLYTLEKPKEHDDLFSIKEEPPQASAKSYQYREKSAQQKKKKWWLFATIVFALIVIMIIVSSGGEEPIAEPEEPVDETVEEVDEAEEKVEEPEEEVAVDENSRTNPAGLNEAFTVYKDDIFVGKATFELEMVELISGDEVWNMVREANPYNDEPEDGKEYILAKFRVKIIETEEDEPYDINHAQFEAVSEGGVTYDAFISVSGLEPDLRNDLYEGAEHTGYTYFMVNTDDSPVAAHARGRNAEVWFDLRAGE